MRVHRIDPMDLDLDTADQIAEIERASLEAAELTLPHDVGPSVLKSLQLTSDCRPVDGLWLTHDASDRLAGWAALELPWRDNLGSAFVRGQVHPDLRRRGIGRLLHEEAMDFVAGTGRDTVYSGAYEGSDGVSALAALGYEQIHVNAIRRIDLHGTPAATWQRLYDEAAARAVDYELVHQVGPTPKERIEDLVTLHDAINDAPLDDPEMDDDNWTPDRLESYEQAMADRHETVYRVMARHKVTGDWAGLSMLCVDEFAPSVAFQEDTSVVRAHRGHRLGLLMKADMLRWITNARPEVSATTTWNSVTNHHMIAVNEAMGATVVARYLSHKTILPAK